MTAQTIQFKSPGVPIFKAPGVVAMDPNCCCNYCNPADYPDVTCYYRDSSGTLHAVPDLSITINDPTSIGPGGTYVLPCDGSGNTTFTYVTEDFVPSVASTYIPSFYINRRTVTIALNPWAGSISVYTFRDPIFGGESAHQPCTFASKLLYTRAYSEVILCGVSRHGAPVLTLTTDTSLPSIADIYNTTPGSISMDTNVNDCYAYDIRTITATSP